MPKRRFGRILVIGLLLVAVVLLGLHAYNFVQLDAAQLSASAEPVLERARTLAERTQPESRPGPAPAESAQWSILSLRRQPA